METLVLYALGVLVIWAIAKYNESNKLFWALYTCFTLGYAACTMVVKSAKQDNSVSMQVSPTQEALPLYPTTYMLMGDTAQLPKKVTSKPVSQAMMPVSTDGFITANVTSSSRDQPVIHVLANPPTPFNTS